MAVLRTIRGDGLGRVHRLDSDRVVMGRHPECHVVLEVGAVSRRHAQIVRVGEEYYVEDLDSRNGTYLNEQAVHGKERLSDHDEVRICDVVFCFLPVASQTGEQSSIASKKASESGMTIVDDDALARGSTVMSTVEVTGDHQGLRLTVNAEEKLQALMEIARNLGATLQVDEVLGRILDSLFSVFPQADRGFIVLRKGETEQLVPMAVKFRQSESEIETRISRTIIRGVMSSKKAILSADAATDSRFDMAESIVDFHIHSMMCAPLVGSDSRALGVLQIDTLDPRHRFVAKDLEVLASVACQAAVAVENAQLHESAVRDRLLQQELAVAHRVQRGFLPSASPVLDGYEFFHFYDPARQLGGDYLDYVPLRDQQLAIVVADVSGKGIAASLLMAKLSAETRYCLASHPETHQAVERLNRVFCNRAWEDRFVTLVLGVIDPSGHKVTFANAGHMAPLLRHRSGAIEPVGESIGGYLLGVVDDATYESFSVTLEPGESVTFYTDGIIEAMNARGEMYGQERLYAALRSGGDRVETLGNGLLDDVRRFVGNHPQSDDMCVACFGREG